MPNPYVNKVVQSNGTTLIDISDTTAVAADVAEGKYFYLATGEKVVGTGEGGGSVTWDTLYEGSVTIVSSSPNYIAINNFSETINEDETWRITWDGVEYVCTPQYSSQIGGCFIGNSTIVGGSDSGNNEPFWAYKRTATQLAISTNDSAGTIALVIERQKDTSATLITKSITANGTYSAEDDDADGYSEVTVNVPSGGASNIATGTFTGTTAGQVISIPLDYSGNGYPVAINIYPTSGYGSDTTIYSLLKRYGIVFFSAIKRTVGAPTFESNGEENYVSYIRVYKSSSSTASTVTGSSSAQSAVFNGALATTANNVTFTNNKTMTVFIASNSYGFIPNVEYTYHVVYSS